MQNAAMQRSFSTPGQRKIANRMLLRATESGDVATLRRMALEAGAEMSGCRVMTNLGHDPISLLKSSGHLTPHEMKAVQHQFTELPQLISGAQAAHGPEFGGLDLDTQSKRSSSKMSKSSKATELESEWASTVEAKEFGSGKNAKLARTHHVMTTLASSMKTQKGKHGMTTAVLTDPRILRAPPELAAQTLPAISKVLKNDYLAVGAVARNPRLLHQDAVKFKKILPSLVSILGSEEEAAYCVAVRSDFLECKPQVMRDAVQAVADCMSMEDAVWLSLQTIVPPSIRVTSRPFMHEDVVGVYTRLLGAKANERPVYRKEASLMGHLPHKARDMFLYFAAGGDGIETTWQFTSQFEQRKFGGKSKPPKGPDDCSMGCAPSSAFSPDQVEDTTWTFKEEKDSKDAFKPDVYVTVADEKQRRGASVLMCQPEDLRECFNLLKEALGVFWRLADGSGAPDPDGARFIGSPYVGLVPHFHGAKAKIKDLGNFIPSNGYNYVQVSGRNPRESALVAWEPICVYLLYPGPPKKPAGEEEEAPPEGEDPDGAHKAQLEALGFFRVNTCSGNKLSKPELVGLPPVAEVYACLYHSGTCSIPAIKGPGGVPPLIFAKPNVAAKGGSGTPCTVLKAKPGECACHGGPDWVDEEAEPEPKDEEAGGEEEPTEVTPTLTSLGEIGYDGYLLLRSAAEDLACEEHENRILLDTPETVRVVVAIFNKGQSKPGSADASPAAPSDGTPSSPSRRRKRPPPPPPAWVRSEGWAEYECRIPVKMKVDSAGRELTAWGFYTKDVKPGRHDIKGAGTDMPMVVFYKTLGEVRTNHLRNLLHLRPSLLPARGMVDYLFRRMRLELGDDYTHTVLWAKRDEWAPLCEATSEGTRPASAIDRWVHEQKKEGVAAEIRSAPVAAAILDQNPSVARVPLPPLLQRCRDLRQAVGKWLLDVLKRDPLLLAHDAKEFVRVAEVMQGMFAKAHAQLTLKRWTKLIVQGDQIQAMFDDLNERHPTVAVQRLNAHTCQDPPSASVWAKWPDVVGKDSDTVSTWIGFLSAEERSGNCQDRVRSFGVQGTGQLSMTATSN